MKVERLYQCKRVGRDAISGGPVNVFDCLFALMLFLWMVLPYASR